MKAGIIGVGAVGAATAMATALLARAWEVRLHPPRPAIHLEACWIDYVITYAMRLE